MFRFDPIWPGVPQSTEWQHIGNQIDPATIFALSDFVNVLRACHRDRSYHFVIAVWRAKEAESARAWIGKICSGLL